MNDHNDVLALVDAWAAAEATNDVTALDALLTDDFHGVGPVGFVIDRTVWTGRFANGLANSAFAVTDPRIRVHGDAAIVIGVVEQGGSNRGEDISGKFRVSLVVLREGDRWRLANVHLGQLKFPGPPAA